MFVFLNAIVVVLAVYHLMLLQKVRVSKSRIQLRVEKGDAYCKSESYLVILIASVLHIKESKRVGQGNTREVSCLDETTHRVQKRMAHRWCCIVH